jgi:hypothetical protein
LTYRKDLPFCAVRSQIIPTKFSDHRKKSLDLWFSLFSEKVGIRATESTNWRGR